MIIRKATKKDADFLAELDKIAKKEIKCWVQQSKKDFENSITNSKFYFLIAYANDKPIAYLESEYDKDKKATWIKNIFVRKEFRKKKTAQSLIKKCTKHWKNKTDLLILLTSDRNLKIFQKIGFKKTANYMTKKIR